MSKNVRMFGVCYHVYFFMEVMNPNSLTKFNTTWAVDWLSYTTATMITSSIGMAVAVLVMVFPTPIRAVTACREQGISTVFKLTKLVDDLVVYFNREEASVRIVQLQEVAVNLRHDIEGMQANIDAAWWETLDLCRSGRSRALLNRHKVLMTRMSDTVFSLQVCISKEDFGSTHIQLMGKIAPQVDALTKATKSCLRAATLAANDGFIDKFEAAAIESKIKDIEKSIGDLAVAFNDARKEISPDQRITVQLQSESFFVYCLSVYARRTMDYTQEMLENPPKFGTTELPWLPKAIWTEFKKVFDTGVILMDPAYRSFTLRNTLSITLAFYVGYFFCDYSGVPAGTVAVLISNFSGSALQKNLGRMQAVTLGQVLPFIIKQAIGTSCGHARVALQYAMIFAWEMITAYIYNASASYGYVGCLLAATGVGTLIYPCLDEAPTAEAVDATQFAAYTKICNTTIAVICMTAVDLYLASATAAELAADDLKCAMIVIDAYFQACLVKRKPNTGDCERGAIVKRLKVDLKDRSIIEKVGTKKNLRSPSTIFRYLSNAEAMGGEANLEPRYHRTPWPSDFFTNVTTAANVLRANLKEFEHVLRGPYPYYSDVFECCREMQPFKSMHLDILNTMDEMLTMVDTILKNDTGKTQHGVVKRLNKLEKIDKIEDMQALFEALNLSDFPGLQYPETAPPTLEEDLLCRLNVVFMIMESTIEKVAEILKACVKELV